MFSAVSDHYCGDRFNPRFSSRLPVHGTPNMTPEKKGKDDKLKDHLIGSIDLSPCYPTTDARSPSHRDQGQSLGS
jgi:hypothetical protein